MSTVPFVEAHGARIPAIGLGTWPMTGDDCARVVADAIGAGYRHIDTAAFYKNEDAVGRGIKASGIARADLFITTKVWPEDIGAGRLQASAEASLTRLGVSYVDLLLIHWPNPAIPLAESIAALADAQRRGLARHVGVSNFPSALLREAVRLSPVPIVTNQIEHYPRMDNRTVMAAARELGVSITAYCPLGRGTQGGVLADPAITALAAAHGKTPAQIILRWHLQQPGVIAVPKSSSSQRLRENLAVGGFTLSASDMASIDALARPDSRVVATAWQPAWD